MPKTDGTAYFLSSMREACFGYFIATPFYSHLFLIRNFIFHMEDVFLTKIKRKFYPYDYVWYLMATIKDYNGL